MANATLDTPTTEDTLAEFYEAREQLARYQAKVTVMRMRMIAIRCDDLGVEFSELRPENREYLLEVARGVHSPAVFLKGIRFVFEKHPCPVA